MKKILVIFAALCVMAMGACFSPWDGSDGQGTIVINLGNGGARNADGEYTVFLTNSDGTALPSQDTGGKATFSVKPGHWNIAVHRGKGDNLNGYGETDVEVQAGATASASINIRNLVPVGGEWNDLKEAIEKNQAEFVMLTKEVLIVNESIQIPSGRNITFLAQGSVTIKKADDGKFDNSMFRVPSNSSLTLGIAGGMSGTITFDGNKVKYMDGSSSSLIYVGNQRIYGSDRKTEGNGGTLTIYDGVILTNNYANIVGNPSLNNRGGAVVVDNGTFKMYGGEISKNTSTSSGGGVRVLSGTFKKTGGTIYGSDGGDNSNTATGGGHAVYYDKSKKSIDKTLGPGDKL